MLKCHERYKHLLCRPTIIANLFWDLPVIFTRASSTPSQHIRGLLEPHDRIIDIIYIANTVPIKVVHLNVVLHIPVITQVKHHVAVVVHSCTAHSWLVLVIPRYNQELSYLLGVSGVIHL